MLARVVLPDPSVRCNLNELPRNRHDGDEGVNEELEGENKEDSEDQEEEQDKAEARKQKGYQKKQNQVRHRLFTSYETVQKNRSAGPAARTPTPSALAVLQYSALF